MHRTDLSENGSESAGSGMPEPDRSGSDGSRINGAGWLKRNRAWLIAPFVLVIAWLLALYGPALWELVQDPQALETFVARLGVFGPIALILISGLQIVVAPIPGYVVQIAAGFLYGPFWGGIWGSIGLFLGASIAFWLARIYGRPLAKRLVGEARLARWESVTFSTSTIVWFVMLLGPTGDIPYYLAGLSRVSFVKILLITLLIRIPTVFVAAAAGAGVMWLSWWQMAVAVAVLSTIVLIFFRYQDRILTWSDGRMARQVRRKLNEDPIHSDPIHSDTVNSNMVNSNTVNSNTLEV